MDDFIDAGDLGELSDADLRFDDVEIDGEPADLSEGLDVADVSLTDVDVLDIPDPFTDDATVWEPMELADGTTVFPYQPTWDPSGFDGVGDPIAWADLWQFQGNEPTCAIYAQGMVLEALTGESAVMTDLVDVAVANSWYDPETGTPPWAISSLLEHHGVPTSHHDHADIVDLHDALARGDKVLVPLNALEIWEPLRDNAGTPIDQYLDEGHLVWVTGMDQTADGQIYVLLNDSGTTDGRMQPVAVEDFVNAWQDYDNLMVVATPEEATA